MPEPTILDTIVVRKHVELTDRKARVSQDNLKARIADMPAPRDFASALRQPKIGPVTLIAEVKKASPSAGVIRADFEPVKIAQTYEANGASCLSVLTDEHFFQGHDHYLQSVRASVALPILRKDFTIDAYQIYEARALGADAILLIVSILTPTQIADYSALAHELGMAALVETHTESEMQIAVDAKASLIGINSRNLATFVTDLDTVGRLGSMAPKDAILVAESGIKTHADVERVHASGAHAILVGETLMRSPDIGVAVRELLS